MEMATGALENYGNYSYYYLLLLARKRDAILCGKIIRVAYCWGHI
jgi:hypothetical protein